MMVPMTDHTDRTPRTDLIESVADLSALDRRTAAAVVRADLKDRSADRSADRRSRTSRDRKDRAREDRAARTADRAQRTADRRKVRAEKSAIRNAWINKRIDYARTNAPAVYSSVIYAASIGVAIAGQVSAASGYGWPVIVGVGIAVFVEGTALTMALTAHQLRMQRERALLPRTLTWVFALFAATVNFTAHDSDRILAAVLATSSLAGITVWEIRSGAKNRPALRKLGAIPEPGERFGVRRWIRFFPSTFAAWSLDIRERATPRAAELIAKAAEAKSARTRDRDRQRLVRAAAFAVRVSSLRGPSPVLAVLQSATDLLATGPIRAVPETAPVPGPPKQQRTLPSLPVGPQPDPQPAIADRPAPRTTNVSPIGAGSDERFLALVRRVHPDGPVTWAQVRKAIEPHLSAMGLQESKGRIKRVREKLLAERGLTADDSENQLATRTG
jgi:Protein of unknown function (DUF2637)